MPACQASHLMPKRRIMTAAAAALRHAAPLLNIRAPIFAGLGAAGLFALVVLVVAIFGDGQFDAPSSTGRVGPVPQSSLVAASTPAETSSNPITFTTPDESDEVSLSGVNEGFEAAQAPTQGSDPAAAEASQVAAVTAEASNPNALPPAPIAGLTEPGPGGPLPVIGAGNQRPSRAYARPFHGDPNTPMIGIVVGGMGVNPSVTNAAIDTLPPEVALSFSPYVADLQAWIDRARAAGHEVLIEAPMEPFDYPNSDTGPYTLLADGPAEENERRLMWILSRTTGYFGVANYQGTRFSTSRPAVESLMQSLERRGLAYLHDGVGRRSLMDTVGTSTNIEYAIADRILDEELSPTIIDQRLLALEALAIQNGAALGSGFAYPVTVEQVEAWAQGLELRGYQLAPPSAIMSRRRLEARLAAEAQAGTATHDEEAQHRWMDDAGEGEETGSGYDHGGH